MVRLICVKFGAGCDMKVMTLDEAIRYTRVCLKNRDYDRIELQIVEGD